MFVYSKCNVILPSLDGSIRVKVKKEHVGEVPDWACKTPYFEALVNDGKIVIPASHKDKDLQEADEKPVRRRRKVEE